jgi:hypothetical protein
MERPTRGDAMESDDDPWSPPRLQGAGRRRRTSSADGVPPWERPRKRRHRQPGEPVGILDLDVDDPERKKPNPLGLVLEYASEAFRHRQAVTILRATCHTFYDALEERRYNEQIDGETSVNPRLLALTFKPVYQGSLRKVFTLAPHTLASVWFVSKGKEIRVRPSPYVTGFQTSAPGGRENWDAVQVQVPAKVEVYHGAYRLRIANSLKAYPVLVGASSPASAPAGTIDVVHSAFSLEWNQAAEDGSNVQSRCSIDWVMSGATPLVPLRKRFPDGGVAHKWGADLLSGLVVARAFGEHVHVTDSRPRTRAIPCDCPACASGEHDLATTTRLRLAPRTNARGERYWQLFALRHPPTQRYLVVFPPFDRNKSPKWYVDADIRAGIVCNRQAAARATFFALLGRVELQFCGRQLYWR